MYSKEKLQDGLQTQIFGRQLHVFDTIDSTNSHAKKLASAGVEEGTVCITEHQTVGRGRLGRSWIDEPGCSVLLSVILRPHLDSINAGLLSFFAAAGAALTFETATGLAYECKWPNDVLLNGKKCCGILIESVFQSKTLEFGVMGVGINVNQTGFTSELAGKATSLRKECAREFDRCNLFQSLMMTYESLYKNVQQGDFQSILSEWKKRASMLGKFITLRQSGEEVSGRAIDISADGALIVETSRGRRSFYAGDVTVTDLSFISPSRGEHYVPRI